MSTQANRPFVLTHLFLGILALAIYSDRLSLRANAQPGLDEAVAGRQKLVSQVTAIGGDVLRTRLRELAGNNVAERNLAHWYAGQLKSGDEWLAIETVQQEAASDSRLTEYRSQRDEISDSAADHERLARWCQKQNLVAQARVHWLHVLRFQPQHRAALNVLELKWHDDRLIALDEIPLVEAREREFQKQKKQWKAKAQRLRRAFEQGEPKERLAAQAEIRQVDQPAAVPALLEEFAEKGATEEITSNRQAVLMAALGGIDDPAAVETLLEFATRSPRESVRYAAIDQLKSKPLHEYVPILLSEMQMPVEAAVSFNEIGTQIVSSYSYGQEGPGGQLLERNRRSYREIPGHRYVSAPIYRRRVTNVPRKLIREAYDIPDRVHEAYECNGHLVPTHIHRGRHVAAQYQEAYTEVSYDHLRNVYRENRAYSKNAQQTVQKSKSQAAGVAQQLQQFNQTLAQQNERIAYVLTEVTGETLGTYPKSWWNWWGDYLDKNPGLVASGARQQLNQVLLNQKPRGLSRGTWVWTRQGLRSVETVFPGDFVLSQDPKTGELAYKVVVAIAAPRELTVFKLELADGSLHCTPGHVVWVSGAGWQRVSKLQPSQSLHSVHREPQVTGVEEAFTIDSYDLFVEDFHTFFVGEHGLLVHDATPISPTYTALPGFSPATVAQAATPP